MFMSPKRVFYLRTTANLITFACLYNAGFVGPVLMIKSEGGDGGFKLLQLLNKLFNCC